MPDLFPDFGSFIVAALVMMGAQFIYATVGFGAGMFSVALLAFVLPDLAGTVAVLMLLTFVTEVWVLLRAWRHADLRLLLGLLPTMAVGLWLGTQVLVAGDVALLKRLLGVVVAGAGVWFLYSQRNGRAQPASEDEDIAATGDVHVPERPHGWWSLPVGLASGLLAGLFGTGGPPVIVLFRGYGLEKAAFRATLLWYFLMTTLVRGPTYLTEGILTKQVVIAAGWLLPGSIAGMLAGTLAHHRLAEKHFAAAVSVLLVILGALLVLRGGRQ